MSAREAAGITALFAAYLVTRLYDLSAFPFFIDEAIHVSWARQTLQGKVLAGSWDGRWLGIKFMALFFLLPLDAILAARLPSVLAGGGALLACIALARRLYTPREGLLGGLLYVVLPFALLYNRMALIDTFAAAGTGAVLWLSLVVAESRRRRDRIALALALVCMFLGKVSTAVFLPLPLVAAMLAAPRHTWARRLRPYVAVFAPVLLVAALMLWRGHGFHFYDRQVGLGSAARIAKNLARLADWSWHLLTPPVALTTLLLPLWLLRPGRQRGDLFLALATLAAFVPFVVASTEWYPRYLAPALVPLCPLLARFVVKLAETLAPRLRTGIALPLAAAAALLVDAVRFDANLVLDPSARDLPRIEKAEFFDSWGAGTGMPQLIDYLRTRSAEPGGIRLVRFFFWNQAFHGLDVRLAPAEVVSIDTIDPTRDDGAATIARRAASGPTLFLLNPPNEEIHLRQMGRSFADYVPAARRVWRHQRDGGRSALEVWEIEPGPDQKSST